MDDRSNPAPRYTRGVLQRLLDIEARLNQLDAARTSAPAPEPEKKPVTRARLRQFTARQRYALTSALELHRNEYIERGEEPTPLSMADWFRAAKVLDEDAFTAKGPSGEMYCSMRGLASEVAGIDIVWSASLPAYKGGPDEQESPTDDEPPDAS